MKKLKRLTAGLVLAILLFSCHEDDDSNPVAVRTVLMYLVADNNISNDLYSNIASVEQGLAKATSPGTFVIYWDGGDRYVREFPTPTLFRYVVDGHGKVGKREVIRTYDNQNSVSSEVMLTVLNDMRRLCPAECYGLIFGSHATGWLPTDHRKNRSFGDDAGYKIDIPDLAKVIQKSSIHFDYILFDACLMSQAEVAYELKDAADYLILSPAEVLSTGFPYFKITKDLLATNDKKQNVIDIAKGYIDYYRNESTYHWATIAVVKTDEMQALANVTYSIMDQYKSNLSNFTSIKLSNFQSRYGYGRTPLDRSTYDFRAFIRELANGSILPAFEEQLARTVIYEDYVDAYPLVNIDAEIYSGIGCYIPDDAYSKWNVYFKNLQWYTAGGWAATGRLERLF